MKSPLLLTAEIGFIALTLVYYYFFLKELQKGAARTSWDTERKKKFNLLTVVVPLVILIFVSIWSLSGIMPDFSMFPLNFMPVIAVPLIVALVFTFNASVNEALKNIPVANIIRLQSFRFFVEILLWILFIDNVIPVQMSFEGRNFDILAGITAPFIAWFASTGKISRTGLIVWNILCLGLLINIVTVAVLSTPSPVRIFMNEPANTIVAAFPVSLLPGLLVPLAYTLHFFSLRQLLARPKAVAELGVR
jgi:hypothetical protein